MVPLVVARALRLAAADPSVTAVRLVHEADDGSVLAEIDVGTEFAAAWRATGESPGGVRAIETITFAFPRGFPARAPRVALRRDFPRGHPHLNPGPADEPPEPCLVDGRVAELVQTRGFAGLLHQLADWLDKAASLSLTDVRQGWEPVRRDAIDDVALVDGEALRGLATSSGGGALLPTAFVLREDGGRRSYLVDHRAVTPVTVAAAGFGRDVAGANVWRGIAIAIVLWAPDGADGRPLVAGEYLPETVSTIADLRERARSYGCAVPLDGLMNQLALGLRGRTFQPTPLTITFLVRRPCDVIGTTSPIEICTYVVHVTGSDDLVLEDRPIVRLCATREGLGIPVLRRASGVPEASARAPWTLVGCGSVGSKIAVHMARRGFAPSLVVDRSMMSPHNYARHALTPPAGAPDLAFKAPMLADVLAALRQRPRSEVRDALDLASTPEGRAELGPPDAGLLDTTASQVLRESLTALAWEARPAMAEAHLLGAGRVAYAAFEGPGGNPKLSDLAVESYRAFSRNRRLGDVVFGAEAQAIAIGQGCSAFTFPMPDGRLSALTAGLAEALALRRFPRPGATGEFLVGELGPDGLSQTWTREAVPPWVVVREGDSRDRIAVRMSSRADEAIKAAVAARPGEEAGGVIVGRFSQIGAAFQIVDVLPAPPDSTFSVSRFVLGTLGLKAAIRDLARSSGGSLYVLGTWHNHLVASGPSALDARSAVALALRQHFPVLLLIALPAGYTCLVAESVDAEFIEGGRASIHGGRDD